MSTAFDALAALFKTNHAGLGRASTKPKGQQGQRVWAFHLDTIDRDLIDEDDAGALIDLVKDETGLQAMSWHQSVVAGNRDDQSDDYTYLLGHLDKDPAKCWAIHLEVCLPHADDFDVSARVRVLEDPQAIRQLKNKLAADEFEGVARSINTSVQGFVGTDSDKLEQLIETMRDSEGGGWVTQMEAYFNRRGLDAATPKGKATSKRRM